MNSYSDFLETIGSLSKVRRMHRNLSNIEKLCESYNHPQQGFPIIHVAGTNGKGSVCTKIANSLHIEGYVTGLYTSPHISTFRERIQIGNQMISEEEIASLFAEVQEAITRLNIPATFFEIATFLAFLHFQRNKIDVAIIETGLGGRWDATNVTTPIVSIITSIGYDHMDILGTSLEDIAREKAGIIKKGVPVVIGPDVPYSLIKEKADELDCSLYQNQIKHQDFDQENQETARLALNTIDRFFPTSEESIYIGLKTKPGCRFERYSHTKEVVLDVAHNSHGFARLLQMLLYTYPHHDYRFLVGFSKGKDISASASLIQDKAHAVHLVSGLNPRLASVQEIQHAFVDRTSVVHFEKTISQGIQNALEAFHPKQEVLVIAGSFFIMSEARKALGLQDPEDPNMFL